MSILTPEQASGIETRGSQTEKILTAICIAALVVFWRWLWGYCWNPLDTLCSSGAKYADNIQHHYAWATYAQSNISSWLPPKFSNWTWPQEVSLIFGDTIPIASIIFAPIARLTGQSFQYFSTLSLISLICSYLCGAWIGQFFYLKAYQSAFIGLAMALSPLAILRTSGHEALSLHSIVIFAIALTIRRIRSLPTWTALIFIALGTHAYYFPIVVLLCIFCQFACNPAEDIGNTISPRGQATKHRATRLAIIAGASLFCLIIYGYIPNTADLDPGGSTWSANIFALLDPQGHSFVAKPLDKLNPFQWEGFSYLGWLGITAAMLSAGRILSPRYKKNNTNLTIFPKTGYYWSLIGLLAIFSLGTTWFAGNNKILHIPDNLPLINQLFSTFRATGRFMWPAYYSLILWGLINTMRSSRFPKALVIFFMLLLVESHIPVMLYIKQDLSAHYHEGEKWQKKMNENHDPMIKTLKKAQLFLNATGDPHFETESLPSFMPQAVKPEIATNYKPYLARMPKGFNEYNTGKPCTLAKKLVKRAGSSFDRDNIYLIMPVKDANECSDIVDISSEQILIAKSPTAVYSLAQETTKNKVKDS